MNRFERAILTGIARMIDEIAAQPLPTIHPGDYSRDARIAYGATKHLQKLAADSTVEVDLSAFLGMEPTASERTMASRAYKSLEAAGLIERLHSEWADRTTHVRLLPAGRAEVVDSSSQVINLRDSPTATVPSTVPSVPVPPENLIPGGMEGDVDA